MTIEIYSKPVVNRVLKTFHRTCSLGLDDQINEILDPFILEIGSKYKDPGRVKPAAPLFKHPTNYPRVFRQKEVMGVQRKDVETETTGFHPYPDISTFTHSDIFQRTLNGTGIDPAAYAESSNWRLKTALAIKKETVNLGESLAELNQTAVQLLDAGRYLVNAVRRLRKGRLPPGVRSPRERWALRQKLKGMTRKERKGLTLDSIPAAWLGARFGVGPIIHDTYKSYLALRLATLREVFRKIYVKDSRTTDFVVNHPSSGLTSSGGVQVSDRVNIWVTLDVDTPIDFGNPLELTWELLPGSMIADWIFNIGDVLSGLDAMTHVTDLYGTRTTKEQWHMTVTGGNDGWSTLNGGRPYVLSGESFGRTIVTSASMNYSLLRSLEYKPSTNIKNMLDGLAILRQFAR